MYLCIYIYAHIWYPPETYFFLYIFITWLGQKGVPYTHALFRMHSLLNRSKIPPGLLSKS